MSEDEIIHKIKGKAANDPQFAIAFAILHLSIRLKEYRVDSVGDFGVLRDVASNLGSMAGGLHGISNAIGRFDPTGND